MKFEDVILSVLEDFKDINLHSEAGRKVLLGEIMAQIKNPKDGWFLDMGDEISKKKKKMKDYVYSRDLLKAEDYKGGHLG